MEWIVSFLRFVVWPESINGKTGTKINKEILVPTLENFWVACIVNVLAMTSQPSNDKESSCFLFNIMVLIEIMPMIWDVEIRNNIIVVE